MRNVRGAMKWSLKYIQLERNLHIGSIMEWKYMHLQTFQGDGVCSESGCMESF